MKGSINNRLLLFMACFFTCLSVCAQDKSNRGKEFWLGYGFHWIFVNSDNGGTVPLNSQEMALYISAEQAATVTVSINGTSWSQTVNIPANTVDASILIPKTGADDARLLTDGLSTKGIHIVSDVPVAVYAHVYVTQGSGATMLMPVETYGYSYYSVNYSQATSNSPLPIINPTTANGNDWYSWFYVIASEDNTRLEISPSDTTKNGWLPGQTYTVNLNKGEIYNVFGKMVPGSNQAWAASKDMTGSKIKSVVGADGNCHPVAVFSGSGGIRICRGDGGEYMQQQVFPAQAWGTRYLTYHTINNTNTDILETNRNYYRVCVSDPSAVVKRNGVVLTGLTRNFFYEFQDSTGGDYIESDKPVLVSQYTVNENQCWNFPTTTPAPPSNGDPEMFYLSPIEQGQKSVRLFASRQSPAIAYVYTNIVLPTAGVSSLRVDGAPLPASQIIPHPNYPSYSVALARFTGPAAQHTITSDSSLNATIYGLGNYESYGYNAGTLINNLNHYSSIKNTFNTSGNADTFTCPKTPVRLFVKVGYQATAIHWKLSQVAGITPNADSIINNPIPFATEQINGRSYYVYTLQQDFTFASAGTYNIPVSYSAAVIENCNQTEYASVKVVVKPGPQADFSIPSACPNQSIVLTGTSTTNGFNISSYLWNFPDATTQTTVNATKTFPAIGSYPVRYRIYADNGCAGDTTKNVVIGSPVSLSVQAIGKACADSVFSFTSSIPPNTGNPPSWYWNFGDGNSTTVTNSNIITHSYSASAVTRTVRHAVGFTTGCGTDTVTYIIPVINSNPVASYSFVADTLCVQKPVQFNSSLTGISAWLWNFGNGTSIAAPPLQHTFSNAGSFNVSLAVKDVNGCGSLPVTNIININAAPAINAGPDKYFRFGNPVTLDASISNPGNYDFIWTPSTYLNLATILNPVASPDRKMVYTILATDKTTHCAASDSVLVKPISIVQIPNAFTPNNDGKNDLFKVLGTEMITKFNLKIFNRYGQLVFETSDKNTGWDGKLKGYDVQAGGFIYRVTYSAPNYPDVQVEKGSFVLIR